MPSIDTFNWLVTEFWPHPDEETARFLKEQRLYLQGLRNEDARSRYLEELTEQLHELKRRSARS